MPGARCGAAVGYTAGDGRLLPWGVLRVALTDADVLHVAALARLALSEGERARLREQLSSILGYMEILDELDTGAILPTAQVIETTTVMREDAVRPSLDRAVALQNAPHAEAGYFRVDAVLETE